MNRKKELDKEYEDLITVAEGKVSEAKEVLERKDKEIQARKEIELESLRKGSKYTILTYNRLMAEMLLFRLGEMAWPHGWTYQVSPTEKGVVMEMKSPVGRYFRAGFKSTGMEVYDLGAIDLYAIRAENTIEKLGKENGKQRTD